MLVFVNLTDNVLNSSLFFNQPFKVDKVINTLLKADLLPVYLDTLSLTRWMILKCSDTVLASHLRFSSRPWRICILGKNRVQGKLRIAQNGEVSVCKFLGYFCIPYYESQHMDRRWIEKPSSEQIMYVNAADLEVWIDVATI